MDEPILRHPVIQERIAKLMADYAAAGGKGDARNLLNMMMSPYSLYKAVKEDLFDPKNDPAFKPIWKAVTNCEMPRTKKAVETWVKKHISNSLWNYFEYSDKRKLPCT